MAGGVPVGRLEIELIASIARLQEDMRKVQRLVGGTADSVSKSARQMHDNLSNVGRGAGMGMRAFQQDAQRARGVVAQLIPQLNDLGVQFAMAAQSSNPLQMVMMALIQQGTQIQQIGAQAGVGIGGMAKQTLAAAGAFLIANPLIAGAAVVAGTLAAAVGLMTAEINKSSSVTVTWQDTLLGAFDATKQYLEGQLSKAFAFFGTTTGEVWNSVVNGAKWAANLMIGVQTLVPRNIITAFQVLPAGIADVFYSATNGAIRAINALLEKAVTAINGFADLANPILAKVGLSIPELVAPKIGQLQNAYAGAAKAAGKAFVGNLVDTVTRDFIGEGATFVKPFAIARAHKRLAEEAKKGGKKSGGGSRAKSAVDDAMSEQRELANWLDSAVADMIKRQQEWKDEMPSFLEQETEAREAQARVREGQLLNEQRLLDVYLQQIGAIRQMGGMLGPIAGILEGLKTGNFAGIGGKAGAILGLTTGAVREVDGHAIAETLGDKLKEIFGKSGDFFQNLSSILANAALGSTAAGLAGGSKLGGGIGGAIGGFLTGKNGPFGKALEGSLNKVVDGLGSFAGPLGSIAGGLLGGALGGLFKPKPKYASAGLFMNEYGDLAGGTASGNAGSAIRAASGIASNVADGLNSLAEQLGAKITGVPNIKVGTYDGKYRVNVKGRGGKMDFKGNSAKGLYNFGDDEQAAIEFAIQKSIEGAVLTGISQASINILKSGQDLQKAIEKATLIEEIPRELQRRLDPVGYAIDELNKKWMRTVDALREGGATAQQMADAQKLYNLELGEAKDNAGEASRAMKDFLKAMNMGSSSPLSLRDQAMNAKSALDPFLDQINAGQAINQDKYLEAAQTYLDIERQMYGSTAKYFEAFDAIQAATNKAISTVDNAAPIRTTADPFIEATATATRSVEANTANTVMLLQQNVELQKENNALLQKLAAKGETWSGSLRNYG